MSEITIHELAGAEFSECRNYRYSLWRIWDKEKPLVMFIGLNPSTANETDNDPTIKSVCRIAKNNGYGGVYMMNCFPLVSTNPEALRDYDKEVFSQHQFFVNNQNLISIASMCAAVVFAWGNFKVVADLNRDKELLKMFPDAMALQINKNGSPKHPLYCKSDTKLISYTQTPIK